MKLKRLANGYVLRGDRIVDYELLTDNEKESLKIQELATPGADEQLNEDEIVRELFTVDGALTKLYGDLPDVLIKEEANSYKARIAVLARRESLLRALLNKKLANRKSIDVGVGGFNVNSADGLSDEILIAAMAGVLSEAQQKQLEALLEKEDE